LSSQYVSIPQDEKEIKEAFKRMRLLDKHTSNGETAMQQQQWADAVESFEAALAMDPEHVHHRPKFLQQICTAQLRYGKGARAHSQTLDFHVINVRFFRHFSAILFSQLCFFFSFVLCTLFYFYDLFCN
jgi:hypothetical protein